MELFSFWCSGEGPEGAANAVWGGVNSPPYAALCSGMASLVEHQIPSVKGCSSAMCPC